MKRIEWVLVTLLALLFWYRKRILRLISKVGKPPPRIIIPVLQDEVNPNEDFIKTLFRLSRSALSNNSSYGLGIINNFGNKRKRTIVLLTKPEHVFKVLTASTSHGIGVLRDTAQTFIGQHCLFALEGPEWEVQRRLMTSLLSPDRIQSLVAPRFEQTCFKMCSRLAEHIKKENGSYVDVHSVFTRLHVAATLNAFLGDEMDLFTSVLYPSEHNDHPNQQHQQQQHQQQQQRGEQILAGFEYLLETLPVFQKPNNRVTLEEFKSLAKKTRQPIRELVEMQLQKNPSKLGNESPVEYLLNYYETILQLPKEEILDAITDNITQLVFAGFNTVAVTLSFSLFYLVQNPVWWTSVRQEVDLVMKNAGDDAPLALGELPLLNAVYLESLRLVPPTGFTSRILEREIELEENLFLEKNTDCFIPIVFIGQNEQTWGSDCLHFNPRRFLNPQIVTSPNSSDLHTFMTKTAECNESLANVERAKFIPFSLGKRGCPGEQVSKVEALTALTLLCHFFTFDSVPGGKQVPKWTGFGIRPFEINYGKVAMNLKIQRRKTLEGNKKPYLMSLKKT